MELTNQQIKERAGLYTNHYMYCGFMYTQYKDVTLSLHDVYELDGAGCNILFESQSEIKEYIRKRFLENKYHESIYIIGHINTLANCYDYLETFRDGSYWSGYDIYSAKWFYSKKELFEYLDNYCYLDGSVIFEYDREYLINIFNNEATKSLIRKVVVKGDK